MTNLQDKRLLQIVFFAGMISTLMLTGCMGVPVSYSEEENQFERDIKQLIGSNSSTVEKKLGRPTSRIKLYDSTVFIYARVAEANVLDLLVPVATYKNTALLCYKLVFDANKQLVRFGKNWYAFSGYHSPKRLCQMWISSKDYLYDASGTSQQYDPKSAPIPKDFYECNYEHEQRKREKPVYWKQVKYLWSADDEELIVAAKSGNPEARLQLYWNDNSGIGLYWLCRAANQGYPKARYRYAQLFEFGDDGIDKDLLRAHMWYDLAAQACHPWARKDAMRISSNLNEDERRDAIRMVEQWSPVDCKVWPWGFDQTEDYETN